MFYCYCVIPHCWLCCKETLCWLRSCFKSFISTPPLNSLSYFASDLSLMLNLHFFTFHLYILIFQSTKRFAFQNVCLTVQICHFEKEKKRKEKSSYMQIVGPYVPCTIYYFTPHHSTYRTNIRS